MTSITARMILQFRVIFSHEKKNSLPTFIFGPKTRVFARKIRSHHNSLLGSEAVELKSASLLQQDNRIRWRLLRNAIMEKKVRKAIKKIMAQMQCAKNFECAESEFDVICKAKDFGLKHYLECLEPEPQSCNYALCFGAGYLCSCPLRVYVSKNLKK